MRFYWTAEEVAELLEKAEPFHLDDFVAGHCAFLRMHLRRIEPMKPGIRREQEWKLVEAEARKLEIWLEGKLGAPTS